MFHTFAYSNFVGPFEYNVCRNTFLYICYLYLAMTQKIPQEAAHLNLHLYFSYSVLMFFFVVDELYNSVARMVGRVPWVNIIDET